MYKITNDINNEFSGHIINFNYDVNKCKLNINIPDIDDEPVFMGLEPIPNNNELFDPNIIEFLKFLNQDLTFDNYFNLNVMKNKFSFENVWNRRKAYIHSTFSDSNRGYIGLRNDFYVQPTKAYVYSNHGSEFWIRFTTNGIDFLTYTFRSNYRTYICM